MAACSCRARNATLAAVAGGSCKLSHLLIARPTLTPIPQIFTGVCGLFFALVYMVAYAAQAKAVSSQCY